MAIALLGTPTAGGTAGATTTSFTISVPTAAQGLTDANTLLLLSVCGVATAAADIPTPAGWSIWQANLTPATNFKHATFYRFASAEPASYSVSSLTSGRWGGNIRAYSGVDATTPQDVTPTTITSATAMVTPASITPVTAGAWVDCTNSISQQTTVTSTTWTSSNMTKDTDWGSSHATLANGHGGTAHFAWSSGAFSPNLTQASGTATRGAAITSAIRPAATTSSAAFLAGTRRRALRPPMSSRRGRGEVPPSQVVVTPPPAKVSDPRRVARGLFPQRRKRVAERIPFAHDNFNRATLTASWICAGTPVTLDGSAVVGSTAANAERWAYPVTNNSGTVYSQATYKAGHFWAVAVAMPAFAQGDPITGGTWYVFRQQTGTNGCIIGQKDLGLATTTTLASSATNFAANDVTRLEYDGTTLNAYINGSLLLSVNPASPISLTAQPYAGFSHASASESGVVLLDDWSAGPFTPTPAASVFPFGMGRPWRRPVLPMSRRRSVEVTPPQPKPPPETLRRVRRFGFVARRDRSLEVPPAQVAVTPPPAKVSDTRRVARRFLQLPRRDRSVEVTPPQSQPPPETLRRVRRFGFVARRDRSLEVPPAQVVVTPPAKVSDARRVVRRLAMIRRDRSVETPPPQIVVTPPVYRSEMRRAVRRIALLPRRDRSVEVVPPQQAAPAAPQLVPTIPTPNILRGIPRRGRHIGVVPPQVAAPAVRYVATILPRHALRALRRIGRAVGFLGPAVAAPPLTSPEKTLTADVYSRVLIAETINRPD